MTDIGYREIHLGDLCSEGFQLRPHIVWFGEAVPLIETAAELVNEADILLVVGTSMAVYPAAGLVHYVKPGCPIYLVDPNPAQLSGIPSLTVIRDKAGSGVPVLVDQLLHE